MDDHRLFTRELERLNQLFFSYQLPEDKTLRVVLRGIQTHIDIEKCKDELKYLSS